MNQPLQSRWQSGGFLSQWQITSSMGRSRAKYCAPTLFLSISNITVTAHTIYDQIWPLHTYNPDVLQVLQENCTQFIQKEKNLQTVASLRPMEGYWAVLKKAMYDGGWKLWERIKHKACKVPVKTIKKLFQTIKDQMRKCAERRWWVIHC